MLDIDKPIMVTKASLPPYEEYTEMLKPIWESAWLTNMGQFHERLKEELRGRMKVDGLDLFVNGHMALEMVLQAFELEGEVITTPFTFASTAHAIVRNGLTPVFCDIHPDDYTIDESKIEELITDRTCAIVPVHVYGNLCNVKKIAEIAEKYNLKVIYDAAHAFGEEIDGTGVGNFGDASMFSFHATKVFNTIEGGAVSFHETWLADRLYKLKNFGIMGEESVEYVGGNAKMNEFQAAMGLCNLHHLSENIEKRKKISDRYRERLNGTEGIRLAPVREEITYNYAYMPVVFDNFRMERDEVYAHLRKHNIYPRKYFYPCVNAYECYRGKYSPDDTPVARDISTSVMTLPIYPDLSLEAVDYICDLILEEPKP
ncbi:DegT/DnrJ/EryC1/StrS family aminotransferase [Clostridium sp. AM58-1XD]|uniref:DegT/DnrJ/EryC1/StrS family aminotransferase n=1 Tax=Clostridium sp. AM58-1XD TaxID=2292307 RepID=UPI000E4A4CBB|nr:DegT/DnrJ/EryC1/StrS family aminotransferase [Clostridium sp. AM58-1XD]RGY98930.1 DegT/DnrJ/EryC1/StrS family aminotransferase [Clostridium sp. AM58-1XD]